MSHKIILSFGVFFICALGALHWRGENKGPGLSASTTDGLQGPTSLPSFKYGPTQGKRYVYKLKRHISFLGKQIKIPDTDYSGEIYLDVVQSNGEAFDAVISESIAEFPQSMPVSARIKMDASGKQLSFFTASNKRSELEEQQLNLLKDTISNWAFLINQDTVGQYDAKYFWGRSLTKQKLGYEKKSKPIPKVISSTHRFEWDEKISFPFKIEGEEELLLGLADSGIRSNSSYRLVFDRCDQIAAYSINEMDKISELTLAGGASVADNPNYKNLDWASMEKRIEALSSMGSSERLKVFGDLIKYLRANGSGDHLTSLLALLTREQVALGPNSPIFQAVVGALATVATPEMQSALVGVYQDSSATVSGKVAILQSLITTQAALDEETRAFFSNEMSSVNPNLASGAAYALGSALQSAGDSGAAAIASLQDAWNLAQGNLAKELILMDAMGNSGRAEFISDIENSLQANADPSLRAKAVFALRFINTAQSTSSLLAAIADSDPSVRAAAATAMSLATWREAFRSPLQQCSGTDPQAGVRAACSSTLTQNAASRVAGI